jgi:hypothetical protein
MLTETPLAEAAARAAESSVEPSQAAPKSSRERVSPSFFERGWAAVAPLAVTDCPASGIGPSWARACSMGQSRAGKRMRAMGGGRER